MATKDASKKKPETNESYRGEIRNIERLTTPANDNKKGRVPANDNNPQEYPRPSTFKTAPNLRRLEVKSGPLSDQIGKAQKGLDLVKAGSAGWFIVVASSVFYPLQLAIALVSVAGLGALMSLESSWVGWLDMFGWFSDIGERVFFVSISLSLLIGLLTLFFALIIFTSRGVSVTKGVSLYVAVGCLSLYLLPGANIIPWMWLWCLYVVKSQAD